MDNPRDDPVVTTFVREVRFRLGSRLRGLRLFGSRARGDAWEGSDYDMLVLVDERAPEVRDVVLDIEVGIIDEYQALVASVVRSEAERQAGSAFPLARNIAREGVEL